MRHSLHILPRIRALMFIKYVYDVYVVIVLVSLPYHPPGPCRPGHLCRV